MFASTSLKWYALIEFMKLRLQASKKGNCLVLKYVHVRCMLFFLSAGGSRFRWLPSVVRSKVFGSDSPQEEVFRDCEDLVQSVVDGYNAGRPRESACAWVFEKKPGSYQKKTCFFNIFACKEKKEKTLKPS